MAVPSNNVVTPLPGAPTSTERLYAAGKNETAARKAANEFEETFLTSMLENMFQGVDTSPPFGGGHAEQQFRSVLLGEYAKDIVKTGGIGVADMVYREILAVQEGKV